MLRSSNVEMADVGHQAIYGGQLAIPAVVDMLARFRDSATRREQQVFSCMVHNLFDEYQFFTKYPDKVLRHPACQQLHKILATMLPLVVLDAVLHRFLPSIHMKICMRGRGLCTASARFMKL